MSKPLEGFHDDAVVGKIVTAKRDAEKPSERDAEEDCQIHRRADPSKHAPAPLNRSICEKNEKWHEETHGAFDQVATAVSNAPVAYHMRRSRPEVLSPR